MQQYDQRRLRLFAVVLFLGIMAANLGRYLIFGTGLYRVGMPPALAGVCLCAARAEPL